jgi:hypothetical protein
MKSRVNGEGCGGRERGPRGEIPLGCLTGIGAAIVAVPYADGYSYDSLITFNSLMLGGKAPRLLEIEDLIPLKIRSHISP